ncbi:hypothetical protein ShirakiTB12_26370 [Priestia megaterium]|uniref:Uncharacterized protein n=1 Tax=Priestia megaterium TaxID=1404 RepID=A0AAX6BKD6_PRIMG|nr:hypothetical protein ShirakiTB12_26370 [Priestia megaterium]
MRLSPLSFPIFSDKLIIYSLHRICKEGGDPIYEDKEGEIPLGSRWVSGLYHWIFTFTC